MSAEIDPITLPELRRRWNDIFGRQESSADDALLRLTGDILTFLEQGERERQAADRLMRKQLRDIRQGQRGIDR